MINVAYAQYKEDKKKKSPVSLDFYGVVAPLTYDEGIGGRAIMPLWGRAHKRGYFHPSKSNALFSAGLLIDRLDLGGIYFDGVVRGLVRTTDNSLFSLEEWGGSLSVLGLKVSGGKLRYNTPKHSKLGTGGIVSISGNAPNFRHVRASLDKYYSIPLPLLGFLFEWKGDFMFTFLEDKDADDPCPSCNETPLWAQKSYQYHEKNAYLRTNFNLPFKFSLGMVHIAQYGGDGSELSDVALLPEEFRYTPGNPTAYQGNSIGMFDAAFHLNTKSFDFVVYRQHPFETKDGFELENRKDIWGDGLAGVSLKIKGKHPFIQELTAERIDTRDQNNGTETYYAEDLTYQCGGAPCKGLVYGEHGFIIGNPLFLTSSFLTEIRAYSDKDLSDIPDNSENSVIASNRIEAIHGGIKGWLSPNITYYFKGSRVKHHGTYLNPFPTAKTQYHLIGGFGLESCAIFCIPARLNFSFAYDYGDLYTSHAVLMGISWNFNFSGGAQ